MVTVRSLKRGEIFFFSMHVEDIVDVYEYIEIQTLLLPRGWPVLYAKARRNMRNKCVLIFRKQKGYGERDSF